MGAIRMKTTRQLKEIFDELEISHKGLDKEALKKKAYKEDAVARWEKLHPEKAYKKPKGAPGGGIPGMEGFGSGDPKMEEMLRQMRGDFSGEKDPERKRILEKLAKKGMSFGGGSSMDTEQLRQMEKMLDGLPSDLGKKAADADEADTGSDKSALDDEDVDAEDKMEL